MASSGATLFKLTVLAPGGRDREQYFDRPAETDSPAHPPVNFHGFAACTGGSFHRDVKVALTERSPVLLLLRGNFKATRRALAECKKAKRPVAVSLKETGLHQISEQLSDPGRLSRFMDIVAQADGCIATTPEAAELFRLVRLKANPDTVVFIPTPYPLEAQQWDMSIKPDQQSGIFVGTREWDVPSRNHSAALLLARQLNDATNEPVTVFNLDGRKGGRLLGAIGLPSDKLRIISERKNYADYVREMAKHKIVVQLDRSRVPGQVAGDALLARTLCVGGDGTTERIAFAKFCGQGRSFEQLGKIAFELIKNTNARATAIVESQWRAMERLSFEAVRKQLEIFFERIAS